MTRECDVALQSGLVHEERRRFRGHSRLDDDKESSVSRTWRRKGRHPCNFDRASSLAQHGVQVRRLGAGADEGLAYLGYEAGHCTGGSSKDSVRP